MNLLDIAKTVALNTGEGVPAQIIGNQDRAWREFLSFANLAGEELARRVDWGQLRETVTFTGDGTNQKFTMPTGFSRIIPGVAALAQNGAIVRPLTHAEWKNLPSETGTPRYFYLQGNEISFWPYLPIEDVSITYQSKNWCSSGLDKFTEDSQEPLFNADLLAKGILSRWRRHKGMEFADYEAEYEAALGQFAEFDDRSRL